MYAGILEIPFKISVCTPETVAFLEVVLLINLSNGEIADELSERKYPEFNVNRMATIIPIIISNVLVKLLLSVVFLVIMVKFL